MSNLSLIIFSLKLSDWLFSLKRIGGCNLQMKTRFEGAIRQNSNLRVHSTKSKHFQGASCPKSLIIVQKKRFPWGEAVKTEE